MNGAAQYAFLLTQGLAKKNNQNIVLTFRAGSSDLLPKTEVHVCRPLLSLGHYRISIHMPIKAIVSDADAIHIHGYRNFESEIGAFVSTTRNKPLVLTPHGSIHDLRHTRILNFIYDRLTAERSLRIADKIIATCEAEAKDLINFGISRSKVVIIPLGIYIPRKSVRIKLPEKKTKIVLTVSRLTHIRNLEFGLRAFASALRGNSDLVYVIVGDEKPSSYIAEEKHYKAKLLSLCDELNIADRVVFRGQLNGDALWDQYQNADVFIWPSNYDNFASAIVEASHFGLPVVSTPVGIAPDVIDSGRGGILVRHNDVEAMSSAILTLIENSQLRYQMRSHNILKATEYTVEKMLERHVELYLEVCQ